MMATAPQSLTMNAHSLGSCASYMGTSAAPSPQHAYMATAHSTRLLETMATQSPRLMPSDASPARKSSTHLPSSAYVVHVHRPSFFVPKRSLGPKSLMDRSNISTRFSN